MSGMGFMCNLPVHDAGRLFTSLVGDATMRQVGSPLPQFIPLMGVLVLGLLFFAYLVWAKLRLKPPTPKRHPPEKPKRLDDAGGQGQGSNANDIDK